MQLTTKLHMARQMAPRNDMTWLPARVLLRGPCFPKVFLMTGVVVDTVLELGIPFFQFVLGDIHMGTALRKAELMERPIGSTTEGRPQASKGAA